MKSVLVSWCYHSEVLQTWCSDKRGLFSSGSGSQSPKPRCLKGYAPLEALQENSSMLLSSFWWLMVIVGVPWLIGGSLPSRPSSSPGCLLPVCLCVPGSSNGLLMMIPLMGFRTHFNPIGCHLNWIISSKTLFLDKVTFTGTRV